MAGIPQQTFADVLAGKDPAMAVNQFCQRFVSQKPISSGDIVYTVQKLATGGHQATVKLDCLGGVEFAGEVSTNAKDAKTSAAQQVLEMYATEIQSMPFAPAGKHNGKKKKRSASDAAAGMPDSKVPRIAGDPGITPPPNASNKGDLNLHYSKITRKEHKKGEVQYITNQVVGGFQSQVQLPGLPPPWNNEIWAGEVHSKKGDAEQSVAGVALATIRSDPQLMAAYNAPPKPNQWLLNGGKDRMNAKGKGKGKGAPQSSLQSPSGMSATDTHAWQQQYAAAMAANGYSQLGTGFSPALGAGFAGGFSGGLGAMM